MLRSIFLLLALPMLAAAQVEKLETFSNWNIFRLDDTYNFLEDRFSAQGASATVGGRLVYRAHVFRNQSLQHYETWIIDSAGNRLVRPDMGPVEALGNGRWLAHAGNQLYSLDTNTLERALLFPGSALKFGAPLNGRRLIVTETAPLQLPSLWSTDGTPQGNELLIEAIQISFNPNQLSPIQATDEHWCFITADGKAYRTDGTAAGTQLLHEFGHEVELVGLTPQYAILHFSAGLWRLEYATGALQHFFDFATQNVSGRGDTGIKANLNGKVIFSLSMSQAGPTLWSTDGTLAATRQLAAIPLGLHSTRRVLFVLDNQAYYLSRNNADTGGWITDGSPAGTRRLAPADAGVFLLSNSLQWDSNRILITAFGKHQHSGLWMLADGALHDCTPGPGYGEGLRPIEYGIYKPQPLFAGQHHAYYQAIGTEAGRELYRTDREGRTELVADLTPGVAWSNVLPIGQVGPWVYFVLNHPSGGATLYRVRDDQPIPPRPEAPSIYTWQQGVTSIRHYEPRVPQAYADGLASGESGSVYSAGYHNSAVGLATTNARLTTRPFAEVPAISSDLTYNSYYLARLDGESGQPDWLLTLGESPHLNAARAKLSRAPDDGVYFCSSSRSLHSRASCRRISSAGQELWRLDGSMGTQALYMDSDPEGNLLVLMWLRDAQAAIGGLTFDNPRQLKATDGRWGLAKIRPDGSIAWAQQLDLLDMGQQENSINTLAIGPDGRIYLAYALINVPGSHSDCGDDATTSSIQLVCLAPDGSLLWERPLSHNGIAVPTGLALNRRGLLLLSGFATDDLRLGPFEIEGQCTYWHSFVLTLSTEGHPLLLNRLEGDEPVVYAIAANESGGYAVAGLLGYYPIHIPYPGLAGTVPYGDNRYREFFLRLYSEQHELLDEKRWYQIYNVAGPVSAARSLIRMEHLRENEFLYQHPYSGPIDTFAHSPVMWASLGSMIMRLSMDEPPPAPLIEEGELRMSQVVAFPNPAIDVLTLHSLHPDFKTAQFHLFNSLGQPVGIPDIAAFGPYRYLDVSKLPTGVYFLGIRQGKGWETLRVVVQR
jgi:ELWxxDGT repeat protein